MVHTGKLPRAFIIAVGLLVALISAAIARRVPELSVAGPGWSMLLLELGAGLFLVSAGCVAISRRSTATAGVLLAAVGGAWLIQEWNSPVAGSDVVFTIGIVAAFAGPALSGHLALIYPDVAPGRLGALLIGTGYLVCGFLLGLASALFFDPAAQGCSQCARNLILVRAENGLGSALSKTGLWALTLWALALVVLLLARLRAGSVARRRVLAPVAIPVIGYVGLVAWSEGPQLQGALPVGSPGAPTWPWQAAMLCLLATGYLWTRIRTRRARSVLTQLAVDLGRSSQQPDLRATLSTLLGDPELKVIYELADGSKVDGFGSPDGPQPGQTVTEVSARGAPVAWLSHRPGLLDDPLLMEAITTAAALTIDHERLRAETQAQVASLRASRARIVAASDAERQQLEHNLHDGAQQRLVSLALAMRLARITTTVAPKDVSVLDACDAELNAALEDLRTLAHGLYPSALADQGLRAALEVLRESTPLVLDIRRLPERRHAEAVEAAAYFFVAEIVRRWAREEASLVITDDGESLVIDVEVDTMINGDLLDLEDRLGALDGGLTVVPLTKASTRVRAELPCAL